MPTKDLSNKQKKFCVEYLKDFNAGEAYVRAGYSAKNSNTAWAGGSRLLSNVKVQAHLASLRSHSYTKQKASLEKTLEEIAFVAYGRVTDSIKFSDAGMTIKNSDDLPAEITAAIASVSISEHHTKDGGLRIDKAIRMHNKVAALKLLAKFFGIDSDFNEARAVLKRYGIALVPDDEVDLGWRLDEHQGTI